MNESNIFGVSVRAIIAVELVSAVVLYGIFKIPTDETLKYLAVSAVSFYFGTKQTNGGLNEKPKQDSAGNFPSGGVNIG